jgi:[CysO sulfur-carrier protein]-S-L-cysteine hydrolase
MERTFVKSLVLPREIFNGIVTHSLEGQPEEICGILRGRDCEAYELVRGRNVAPDPVNDYVLDPQTLLLQFGFEETGDEMVGIYHSHPVSDAYPSASDAWNAHYPDSNYLICSLEQQDAPVLRAFRLLPHFPALDMDALRDSLHFYETRPNLFGFFQNNSDPVPPGLRMLVGEISLPFYIVFQVKENSDRIADWRVVSVHECPLRIT